MFRRNVCIFLIKRHKYPVKLSADRGLPIKIFLVKNLYSFFGVVEGVRPGHFQLQNFVKGDIALKIQHVAYIFALTFERIRNAGGDKEEMVRVGKKALAAVKIVYFSASGKDQSVAGPVFDNSLLLRSGTDIAADDNIGNDNVFEDSIHEQYDITAYRGSQSGI